MRFPRTCIVFFLPRLVNKKRPAMRGAKNGGQSLTFRRTAAAAVSGRPAIARKAVPRNREPPQSSIRPCTRTGIRAP